MEGDNAAEEKPEDPDSEDVDEKDEGDDDDEEDDGQYEAFDMKVISITKGDEEDQELVPLESEELGKWVSFALSKLKEGIDFNESVRENQSFRNPAILEKMVSYCELDEHGTNLKENCRFGQRTFEKEEYYEMLAAEQRAIAEGRNMAVPTSSSLAGRGKRSKWDAR